MVVREGLRKGVLLERGSFSGWVGYREKSLAEWDHINSEDVDGLCWDILGRRLCEGKDLIRE